MVAWALLQDVRHRTGLTQAELARRAGVPQSTVAKIERGRRDPSLSTLERLVRAAGLELRIQLAPKDDHDLQLIDAMLDLTPEERLESLEEQAAFFTSVDVPGGLRAPPLRPRALLALLERHEVDYVVIGGVGARIWGSARGTLGLDICAATTRANKKRLAAALTDVEARYRPAGLDNESSPPPGGWDARSFDSLVSLATTTRLGWLDVWFIPDGTTGYDDLIRNASDVRVGKREIKVASIADIIRSKQAAGRNKDLAAIAHLRELEERRSERGRTSP